MTKDVLVTVKGFQFAEGESGTEPIELVAPGKYYKHKNYHYVVYEESAEGYETYLKIYNSTVSTFGDYNLTENETAYLKFLIIYYLNHYGNVSANYTWNESDDFGRFHLWEFSTALEKGFASGCMSAPEESYNVVKNMDNMFSPILVTSSDLNRTEEGSNATEMPNSDTKDNGSWWTYIIILFLALAIAIFVIRRV